MHVVYSTCIYLFFTTLFMGVWLLIMAQWPHLAPGDPLVQQRYLAGKATAVIMAMCILVGILQVMDIKSNGNLLGRIYSNAIASAILAATMLSCTAYLISVL